MILLLERQRETSQVGFSCEKVRVRMVANLRGGNDVVSKNQVLFLRWVIGPFQTRVCLEGVESNTVVMLVSDMLLARTSIGFRL